MVSFRYKPHKQGWKTMMLPALQFLSRFLQHVLPGGFAEVRYYGFLHPSAKARFAALQEQLLGAVAQHPGELAVRQAPEETPFTKAPRRCPQCGGPLAYIGSLRTCPAPRGSRHAYRNVFSLPYGVQFGPVRALLPASRRDLVCDRKIRHTAGEI